ncbi:hypothetical protein JZ751_005419 [Albula glossodonta]|uniref:Uncharacterized protein n=1 Tax=Albula glossodonta TaxID=121402 RepID=A0A8T2MMI3_9TELE|nr:hypothetical protein JZ751_005419 [Albula glossodonta]
MVHGGGDALSGALSLTFLKGRVSSGVLSLSHPAEALHLYVKEEEIEIDSSDGVISEPSTKDPSSSEEEDDSSDDDDGGDDDD